MQKEIRIILEKNLGALYNHATLCLSQCLLDGRIDEANTITEILATHISKSSILKNELGIYEILLQFKGKDIKDLRESVKIFIPKLFETKKEIKSLFENLEKYLTEISFDIAPYVVVYDYIQYLKENSKLSVENVASYLMVEDQVYNYLNSRNKKLENVKPELENIDDLFETILKRKYNMKYDKILNNHQKKFMNNYLSYLVGAQSRESFQEYLSEIKKYTKESAEEYRSGFQKDSYMYRTITDGISKIKNISTTNITENVAKQFLDILKLKGEIESVD